MKKLFSVMVIGSVLTLLIAGSARAQMPGTEMRATIPFDFILRGRILPAGRYEISRISEEPAGLMIRNIDHRRDNAVFETEAVYVNKTPSRDVLVFHRYGDSYFLSEVLTAGEDAGRELAPSRTERQMRQDIARNGIEPQTVTVDLVAVR